MSEGEGLSMLAMSLIVFSMAPTMLLSRLRIYYWQALDFLKERSTL